MKKGFTLVELIAILTILALIGLIIIPTVSSMIKNGNEDLCETQVKILEDSVKMWASKNIDQLPDEGQTKEVSIIDLKKAGVVEKDLKNPITKEEIADDFKVTISNKNGTLIYNVPITCKK